MVDDERMLNAAVDLLVKQDPNFADPDIDEGTIRTRIRRQLENVLNGSVDCKNWLTKQGIFFDDGYNYWIKIDHTQRGAA